MDKISLLLKEAKPLYRKKQKEKKVIIGGLCSFCLMLGIWVAQPQSVQFDEGVFDSYFTALYLSDSYLYEESFEQTSLPINKYGLYEV